MKLVHYLDVTPEPVEGTEGVRAENTRSSS